MVESTVLEISDLSVEYQLRTGSLKAVKGLSLTLERGESFGLVGESGCGKSSIAMAIMRYLGPYGRVTAGDIRLEGESLIGLRDVELQRARRSKLAMVYQEPMSALNPSLTIQRQLHEVLAHEKRLSSSEIERRVGQVLEDVRIPDPRSVLRRYPHQLSGGQQQRIIIAMALLANPVLLILDEPTTALDVTVQAAITDLLADIQRRYGTTLLYISHNLGVISQVCRRVGVMYLGELVEVAEVQDLFRRPRHPYTHGLLSCTPRADITVPRGHLAGIPGQAALPYDFGSGCQFGPRCASFRPGLCNGEDIALVTVDPGRQHNVRCVRWAEIGPPMKPEVLCREPSDQVKEDSILEVRELKKHFGVRGGSDWARQWVGREISPVRAVNGVSFDALRGETVAVVGESGCGKTTLAEMVVGLIDASGGTIRLLGVDLTDVPIGRRDRQIISALQMVFQNPDATLNPTQTVGRALSRAVVKLDDKTTGDLVTHRVRELLKMVQLSEDTIDRYPDQLSGGQKQRVAIARAFAGTPRLVVADEPVSALDVSVQAAIVNLLSTIQEREGTTLLFISHDLGVVRSIADRVVVMYLGEVMESGTVESVFEPPYHPYTEALLSSIPVASFELSRRQIELSGDIPSSIERRGGCPFASRCHRKVGTICDTTEPPLQRIGGSHNILCHISADKLEEFGPVFRERISGEV